MKYKQNKITDYYVIKTNKKVSKKKNYILTIKSLNNIKSKIDLLTSHINKINL
jgi:hypothetical protein